MRDFGKCEIIIKNQRIPLRENRSAITFINEKRLAIRKVEVDGCVITNGLRCDYLLIGNDDHEHYVELKGSKIKHALKQITATIDQISREKNKHPKSCYISSTRCPLTGTDIQKERLNFKKKFNARLLIKNGSYEIPIS